MKIETICALKKIKKLKDNSQDIIYADPPYALGSTVLIGENGKPYYKEAKDFMSKWEMPDEKFWEEFFKESMRVLKYGGKILFFGIDRQLMLFQYYATYAGLETKQSLYWYFISNFPKATDLSKQIEKRLGVDVPKGELISENTAMGGGGITPDQTGGYPETELGKKYDGLKYSISPLKQVLETVMVFQKPTKNKSTLDDVFAYEDGDDEISVSAWNIDGGRVATSDKVMNGGDELGKNGVYGNLKRDKKTYKEVDGRFPPQLLIDEECALRLDEQSGEESECSKILHHIGYHDEELDLLIYSPKVSTFERELGCDSFPESIISGETKEFGKMGINTPEMRAKRGVKMELPKVKNNHPTLKPIKLNYHIAKLLKSPNPQNVFFPFSGVGSEDIGFEQAGFNRELFELSELSEEYVAIGNARRLAWKDLDINNLESTKKHIEQKSKEHQQQGSLF